jgi:hypothetical protein
MQSSTSPALLANSTTQTRAAYRTKNDMQILGTSKSGAAVNAKPMKNGRLYVWQEWTIAGRVHKNCLGTFADQSHALNHPMVRACLGLRACP